MGASADAETGSREPSPSCTGLGPTGFDPARWQPIETAPKDGTKVLLQPGDHRELPFIGAWGHVGRYTSSPSMWLGHEYGAMTDGDISHWMPVPAPPFEEG